MKNILAGLLTLFALIITTQIVFATGQETCPNTAPWEKIDGLNDPTYVYQVPSGKKVVEWCYKSSNTVNYGTSGTPSTTTITVTSTVTNQNGNVQDLSHASFKLEDDSTCTETVSCDDSCRSQTVNLEGDCGVVTCAPNAPAAGQCSSSCHTDIEYVNDGQCGQTTCLPNNEPEDECPTQCGYEGGSVSDGQCGTKACAPTASCEVDQCLNTEEFDSSVPEGQYRDNEGNCHEKTPVCTDEAANNDVQLTETTYSDNSLCTYDRLTPTPTPTPEPTPTPTPGLGKQSKTAITDPVCVGQNFDAIMELFLDGNPVKDVQVKFIYNGEAKYAKTNADGKASVAFGFIEGQDVVKFEPEDGYPTQLQTILKSDSCKTPEVLGATTGKVLGATTLAKTGVAEDALINLAGLMGAGMTVSGLSLYVKKRK